VIVLVLLLLWLPFCWLLFVDSAWSDYRWFWIIRWPGLPALWLVRPLGIESTGLETVVMGAATLLMATLSVLVGQRSRAGLLEVCVALALWGSWVFFASKAMYLA
jgi:hypothetical protein